MLLLLAVAAQASGTGRELTASHASYKQLYDEFDKHVLSDGHVCADTPASLNATVLSTSKQAAVESCRLHCKCVPGYVWAGCGATSPQRSVQCAPACRQNAQCSSWLWCEDDKGCLDGTGATLVKHTCQLRQESRKPWGVPEQGQILVQPSTFASGYVKSEALRSSHCAEDARSAALRGSVAVQGGCRTSRLSGGKWALPPLRCLPWSSAASLA